MTNHNTQSPPPEPSQLLELYREVFETLRHEGNGIWQRFNILIAFNLSLFAAVGLLALGSRRPAMWRSMSIGISLGAVGATLYSLYVLRELWNRHWHWRRTLVEIQAQLPRAWPRALEDRAEPHFRLTQPFLWLLLVGWVALLVVIVSSADVSLSAVAKDSAMAWVNVVGLSFDLAGAFVLAWGLFISEDGALELGQSRWSEETREENLRLPQVRDRLRQSRNAKVGVSLLIIGFALQIIASWP